MKHLEKPLTVDWFLIDALQVVPQEYNAWLSARQKHVELAIKCMDSWGDADAFKKIEAAAIAAKLEADRLEEIARSAWMDKGSLTA